LRDIKGAAALAPANELGL
jgi:hypothetical protein